MVADIDVRSAELDRVDRHSCRQHHRAFGSLRRRTRPVTCAPERRTDSCCFETPGCASALMLGAQQREGVLEALFEDLVGELPAGQGAGDLQRPDHHGENAERLHAC